MPKLDHLALAASSLEEGVAHLEERLGARPCPGGEHALMGTHNALLGMGDLYLEVIAINPAAPPPGRRRWFALDDFAGAPRLAGWVLRCADLGAAIAAAPDGVGHPLELSRGDLRWRMAVPDDGHLPFDGLFPALIRWQGTAHPARMLPDSGLRLVRLELIHPEAEALAGALAGLQSGLPDDERIVVRSGDAPAMRAEFDTPAGRRCL